MSVGEAGFDLGDLVQPLLLGGFAALPLEEQWVGLLLIGGLALLARLLSSFCLELGELFGGCIGDGPHLHPLTGLQHRRALGQVLRHGVELRALSRLDREHVERGQQSVSYGVWKRGL